MGFLQLLLCETLVKRITSVILIAVGLPNVAVNDATGLCDKSVRVLRKSIDVGDMAQPFVIKDGGCKSKTASFEKDIIEEINNNDYSGQ